MERKKYLHKPFYPSDKYFERVEEEYQKTRPMTGLEKLGCVFIGILGAVGFILMVITTFGLEPR